MGCSEIDGNVVGVKGLGKVERESAEEFRVEPAGGKKREKRGRASGGGF